MSKYNVISRCKVSSTRKSFRRITPCKTFRQAISHHKRDGSFTAPQSRPDLGPHHEVCQKSPSRRSGKRCERETNGEALFSAAWRRTRSVPCKICSLKRQEFVAAARNNLRMVVVGRTRTTRVGMPNGRIRRRRRRSRRAVCLLIFAIIFDFTFFLSAG